MPVVDKLTVSIEADASQFKTGLDAVRDDITGFNERVKSQAAVDLSLRLARFQQGKREAEQLLKELRATGDRQGQIRVTADIAIFKQRIAQAQRELTNFSRTGNKDVSVLGKLFSGVNDRIMHVSRSISALGGALTAKVAKDSLKKFFDAGGSASSQFTSKLAGTQNAFERLEVQIGGVLWSTVERFFGMFGRNSEEGVKKVSQIFSATSQSLRQAGSAVRNFGIFVGDVFVQLGGLITDVFRSIPQAAEASFGYVLEKLNTFSQDWAQGVKDLTFGKIDVTGKVGVSNPFAGVSFPDLTRKAKLAFRNIGMDWETMGANIAGEFESIKQETDEVAKFAANAQTTASKKSAGEADALRKKQAEAAKKQAEDDAESVERVREAAFEKEQKRIERRKGLYVTAYETIKDSIRKAEDAALDLSEQIKKNAEEAAEINKDANKELGARYVEVRRDLAEIVSGEVEDEGQLAKLMAEKSFLEKATTEQVRLQAEAYDKLSQSERIVKERDEKLAAIDLETAALKVKFDTELANVDELKKAKINAEREFTAEFQANIAQQIEASKRLTDEIQRQIEARVRLREVGGSSVPADAAAGSTTVIVNNDVKNAVDAKLITDKIVSKLSS
jgi:hypothetical protein